MKFVVDYSLNLDLQNYLSHVWRYNPDNLYGNDPKRFLNKFPLDFQQLLSTADTREKATEIIKNYWAKTRSINFNEMTQKAIFWTQKILDDEKLNIIKKLETIYQQSFLFDQINVYLTTLPICPFDYFHKWFMLQRNHGVPHLISTSIHELNHFMFFYYYQDNLIKQGIDQSKINIVREALAILSNPEGNDKSDVKPLENYIKTIITKPIKEIIELSVKFLN